jgi:hypothetical protein
VVREKGVYWESWIMVGVSSVLVLVRMAARMAVGIRTWQSPWVRF